MTGVGEGVGTGPSSPTVRSAAAADLEAVAGLFSGAVDELARSRGGGQRLADLSDQAGVNLLVHAGRWKVVTEALSSPVPTVWISEVGGEVVGFVLARMAQHSEHGPQLGVVDLLYVTPDASDESVAGSLVAAVRAYFGSQGCTALDAYALPGDRTTKNIYEEAGLKARLLVMSGPVEAGRP